MAGMIVPILVLAALVPNQQPTSELNRGSTLYHQCQVEIRTESADVPAIDSLEMAMCQQYIQGLIDGDAASGTPQICHPASTTLGTVIVIYAAYMEKHLRLMDEYKGIGAFAALKEAYPCPAR
jgi:hypothetical protein